MRDFVSPRHFLRIRDARWAAATCLLVSLLSGVLASGSACAADMKAPLLWTTPLHMLLESSATLADINGDGKKEILIAGHQDLVALGGNGKELWRWHTSGRLCTYPAVLARHGQTPLIYVADSAGMLTCLDGTGKVVWQAHLNAGTSWSSAVVCDLTGDGVPDVIQTDESGTVWAFNANTGKVEWQAKVKGIPVSPAVGDLNGDGRSEVVVDTGIGLLFAFDADGKPLWNRKIGGKSPSCATCAPVIFSTSQKQTRIVVGSSDGQLLCLDKNGRTLWSQTVRGAAASAISVGDIDMDGRADIFVITQIGRVYRFDEDGTKLWDIDMQGRTLAPGAIVDANGNGKLDFVLCTQDGHLQVLNREGECIFDHQFDNRTINVTPAFGDVTANSPGLEMVITGGESGKVFCFGTPAPDNAQAQWTEYRHDERQSGVWTGLAQSKALRMGPEKLTWESVLTGVPVRFSVDNPHPTDQPLKATAVCVSPGGVRQVATTDILGKHGELLMPLNVLAAGVYRFNWFLSDSGGHQLLSGSRAVPLQPLTNDRAAVQRAVDALNNTADQVSAVIPLSAKALRQEAALIAVDQKEVKPLQDAAPGSDVAAQKSALAKTAALVKRCERALAVAKAVQSASALGAGTSLVAFEGPMWDSRGVDTRVPESAADPLTIKRRAVPGEHEPISIDLFNITNRQLQVRVVFDKQPEGVVITPYHSISVPSSLGAMSWDALPELDDSDVISIPPLRNRELWLDINLAKAKSGEYHIPITLQELNGAGVLSTPGYQHGVPPPEMAVDISLDILPFAMAPPGAFRMCTWAKPEAGQIKDLLAHGNNVFTTPLPGVKYDAQGRLTGLDCATLDHVIDLMRGYDVVLLLQGFPALHDPSDNAALKTYLDDLVAHLSAKGFDTAHFALYPIDEPGGQGWNAVNKLVAFGERVKQINPSIMLYMDGGGNLPMFKAMAKCIDIWSPGIYMLPDKSAAMDVVHSHAKMLWSYNCAYSYSRPIGANLKNTNVVAEFRNAALFAYRFGGTGIGFWSYNIGGDLWTRVRDEYMLVYPGRKGPVTSRRWEAVREGIEDCRIAEALKGMLDSKTLTPDARAKIKHLLDVSLPAMIDKSYAEMKRGLGRSVLDASNNDQTVHAFRSEMLDCVQAVASGK